MSSEEFRLDESWLEVDTLVPNSSVGPSVIKARHCWVKFASMDEIEAILNAGSFEIRVLRPVGDEKAPLITANVVVDREKLSSYKKHISELSVALFPKIEGFDQNLFEKAVHRFLEKIREEENQKRSEQVVAQKIHASGLSIYRECTRLELAVKGLTLPQGRLPLDREVLASVAALGDATVELMTPIAEAVGLIINGQGSSVAAYFDMLEVSDPSMGELKLSLRTALKSVQACHFLRFGKENLEENFIAVFLSFLATWGNRGFGRGYLIQSAAIICLLRQYKPAIPDVAGLVENFHETDWVERFVYQISKPDTPAVFYQDARADRQERLAKICDGAAVLLGDEFVKKVLVSAITIKYVVATEVDRENPEALIQKLADACVNPCAPFMPHSPVGSKIAPAAYSVVLAAVCTVAGILPERAVVELRKEGVGRQVMRRYLGLTGGRAVVLTQPDEAKKFPAGFLLYLFGHKDTEGFLKKPPKPSLAMPNNGELECRLIPAGDFLSRRIYEKLAVLWIMDQASYEFFFEEEIELARKFMERVSGGEVK